MYCAVYTDRKGRLLYIFFILILAITTTFCYFAFGREVLCPSIVAPAVFLFSSIVGLIQWSNWQLASFTLKGTIYIELGIISFVMGSVIPYYLGKNRNRTKRNSTTNHAKRIAIPKPIRIAFILLGIIYLFLLYRYIRNTVGYFGRPSGSLSAMIGSYYYIRVNTALSTLVPLPSYLRLMRYFMAACSSFALFIIIQHIVYDTVNADDISYSCIVLVWVIHSYLHSSRGDYLLLLSEGIYLTYFFLNMRNDWDERINSKIINLGIKALVIFLIAFVFLDVLGGRRESLSQIDQRNYLTVYISGGIRNFDLFINDIATYPKDGVGIETFPAVYRAMHSIFGTGNIYSMSLEFRSIDGTNIGNIYTAFRRYYSDFGLIGMMILSWILGLTLTDLYCRVVKQSRTGRVSFDLLLLAYLSRAVFYLPIDDIIFEFECSLNGVFRIFILFILYRAFAEDRIGQSLN